MKGIRIILLVVATLFVATGNLLAQTESEMPDTTGVIIHADPRLALLTAPVKSKNTGNTSGSGRTGVIRSGRGFRVQIYNGNDRSKALQLKVDFLRRYPTIRTYMTYIQPQYRLKVGDFRSRGEAQKLYKEISSLYSPLMIVPDIIMINTAKDD